jgi:hypothetical protein
LSDTTREILAALATVREGVPHPASGMAQPQERLYREATLLLVECVDKLTRLVEQLESRC